VSLQTELDDLAKNIASFSKPRQLVTKKLGMNLPKTA
jgi:hypothetical protein